MITFVRIFDSGGYGLLLDVLGCDKAFFMLVNFQLGNGRTLMYLLYDRSMEFFNFQFLSKPPSVSDLRVCYLFNRSFSLCITSLSCWLYLKHQT